MDNPPSPESQGGSSEPQQAEVLKPRADDGTPPPENPSGPSSPATPASGKRPRRTYRPSHKATYIGLAAVIVILAVNAAVLTFVLKSKSKNSGVGSGQVTISSAALSKIGVNSSTIGNSGVQLTIDPNTQFNGKVTVAGDESIGGQLKLNSKLIASEANFTKLESGDSSMAKLNVSGDSTLSGLSLRKNLAVAGTTQLQGQVIINQLLTVNSSLTVVGNLAIGGTFSARSLASTSILSIGGHVITSGAAPGVGPGSALGSFGTVSISGNDAAGRVGINVGTGASHGILASVSFHNQYSNVPRVVISPVIVSASPASCSFYVINPSVGGFSIEDSCGLPAGGYAIDYIVEQ